MPYKDIMDSLYFQKLHDEKKIIYDAPVKKIDYSGDLIEITDEEGKMYTANKVVVTVSVEVLKSETIEFVPALPQKKDRCLQWYGNGFGMEIVSEI